MKNENNGKCFGRKLSMGIPSYDDSGAKSHGTPLKNRFSQQHDVSMEEAMRVVKGSGTSAQANKKNVM